MAAAVSFAIVRTDPSIAVDELATRVSISLVDGYKRVLHSQVLVTLIIKHQSRNYSDSIKHLVSSIDRIVPNVLLQSHLCLSSTGHDCTCAGMEQNRQE